jgi:hypothetical protein
MARAKNGNGQKLSLDAVLQALDSKDLSFYDRLTDEERKGYSPFILLRYMSSLSPQSSMQAYAVLATNDICNIGWFSLGKHPELQHKLLCLAGTGRKQYRPYVGSKNAKSKTKLVDEFLRSLHPGINATELEILRSQHDVDSLRELGQDAGLSKAEIKDLVEDAKKL